MIIRWSTRPGPERAPAVSRRMRRALRILASTACVACAAISSAGAAEQLAVDAIPVDRVALPIDYPLISGDGGNIAIVQSLDAAGASLLVDISSAGTGLRVRRFDLLSASEGRRPLSPEVRASLAARIVDINQYLADHAFRPMPLLYQSRWERDLAFNEEFISESYRVTLQHPTGALRIESLSDPTSMLDLPQSTLPLGPMPDCLDRPIPIQGWFDAQHRVVVLRQASVPVATCNQVDQWAIKRLQPQN